MSFDPVAADILKDNNFTALFLGNNHSYDLGESGFAETQEYLGSHSIGAAGHPHNISEQYILTRSINNRKMALISLNAARPYFPKEAAVDLLKKIKNEDPETFSAVFIHWGSEYRKTENQAQRNLAHTLIDAGADVIFGTHPHVVQGVDSYNNRPIFYSLGNFIFDQYFSKDAQEGLMIEMQVDSAGERYRLIPVESKESQAEMMQPEKAKDWLADLAARSDASLRTGIQSGVVDVRH
jgi:poly-gamma-glutamate synthesis protein (capsule biosynthesis protein)